MSRKLSFLQKIWLIDMSLYSVVVTQLLVHIWSFYSHWRYSPCFICLEILINFVGRKKLFLLNIFYFSIWLTSNKLYCIKRTAHWCLYLILVSWHWQVELSATWLDTTITVAHIQRVNKLELRYIYSALNISSHALKMYIQWTNIRYIFTCLVISGTSCSFNP